MARMPHELAQQISTEHGRRYVRPSWSPWLALTLLLGGMVSFVGVMIFFALLGQRFAEQQRMAPPAMAEVEPELLPPEITVSPSLGQLRRVQGENDGPTLTLPPDSNSLSDSEKTLPTRPEVHVPLLPRIAPLPWQPRLAAEPSAVPSASPMGPIPTPFNLPYRPLVPLAQPMSRSRLRPEIAYLQGDNASAPGQHNSNLVQDSIPLPKMPTPLPRLGDDEPAAKQEKQPLPPPKFPKFDPERLAEKSILLGAARNAVGRGDLKTAIQRFDEYLAKYPEDNIIRKEFAGVLVQARELKRAVEQYEKLLTLQPESLELRMILADVYLLSREFRQAIVQYQKAYEISRGNLEIATRLARAYSFDGDNARANEVFDRLLADIRPTDPTAPRSLGILLLDLERYTEALPYLIIQQEKHPQDLDLIAALIRCYARIGERQRALEAIEKLAKIQPRETVTRQQLAEALYQTEDYEYAGLVWNQMLQVDPNYGLGIVGTARVALQMYKPVEAKRILDNYNPDASATRPYILTLAEYHQLIGEYMEAGQIYRDLLRRNEADHEVRLSLARLQEFNRELEQAKADYAKIPPSGPLGKRARLGFAECLAKQRRFAEAIDIDKHLLAEYPADAEIIGQLVRHLGLAKQYEQAETVARAYLATSPKSESAMITVRLALGKVLLDAHRAGEAARNYEVILARPTGRFPIAYYGLGRAFEKLGQTEKAAQAYACPTQVLGGDLRARLQLADQFSGDYDDHRVLEMTDAVLHHDPLNLAALIRKLDAQVRLARQTGDPKAGFQTALQILQLSPTNIRGLLALARLYATAQDFRSARMMYDRLLTVMPGFSVAIREKAGTALADSRFTEARAIYGSAAMPSPEEKLASDLAGLVQRDAKLRPILEPYLLAKVGGRSLRVEMARLVPALPDNESQLALQRILNDYDAALAEATEYQLSEEAYDKNGKRSYQAIPAFQTLLASFPDQPQNFFALGQNFANIAQTRKELEYYSKTLDIDPQHREAMVASARAAAEISPQFHAGFNYFYQDGRNGLANMASERYLTAVQLPLGDENEYLRFGYARLAYLPFDDRVLKGNMPFLRVQKQWGHDDRNLFFGQLNIEQYENRVNTRPTFEVGNVYTHDDVWKFRGALFLDNVMESGESLRQDIYRFGIWAGADAKPTRLWGFGGTYRFGAYSDNNNLNQFDLYSEVNLTFAPKELKFILKFLYMAYAQTSVFPTDPPDANFLFGTIHPYFSPTSFALTEARIEWKHWLSRDYFAHANQCWYGLQYGIAVDNQSYTYHNFRLLLHYDCCNWLTLTADAAVYLSEVYNYATANAYLIVRFP